MACTPEITTFIRGDMQRRTKDGFRSLLSEADAVRMCGEKLKLSRIAAVPQAHFRPRLILNLSEKPDVGMPSVNDTTNRETVLESLQFGRSSSRILQEVWEAYPAQGPVRVSRLVITVAYHRGTVTPSQVGAFSYVVPSAPGEKGYIIYINLVLPMGLVDSPKYF